MRKCKKFKQTKAGRRCAAYSNVGAAPVRGGRRLWPDVSHGDERSAELEAARRTARAWAKHKDPWKKIIGKRVLAYITQHENAGELPREILGEFDAWVVEELQDTLTAYIEQFENDAGRYGS
jgi:hypothetical protein